MNTSRTHPSRPIEEDVVADEALCSSSPAVDRAEAFAALCHDVFRLMRRVDGFGGEDARRVAVPACSVSCVRFQQHVMDEHEPLYRRFVGARTGYRGQWHRYVQCELGLRCFTYNAEEFASYPGLGVHLTPNELRCCAGADSRELVRWSDEQVGAVLREHYLVPERLIRISFRMCGLQRCCASCLGVVRGAGEGEEATPCRLVERGESCDGVRLVQCGKVMSRDISRALSSCLGTGFVSQMSRSQLRQCLQAAYQQLKTRCETCRAVEAAVAAADARSVTYRHHPYVPLVATPCAPPRRRPSWSRGGFVVVSVGCARQRAVDAAADPLHGAVRWVESAAKSTAVDEAGVFARGGGVTSSSLRLG